MTTPNSMNRFFAGMSGGEVTVPASGSLVVDTGQVSLGYFQACLAQDSVATAAGVSVTPVPRVQNDGTAKLLIKTWAADGATAASTAAKVQWAAFAKQG